MVIATWCAAALLRLNMNRLLNSITVLHDVDMLLLYAVDCTDTRYSGFTGT